MTVATETFSVVIAENDELLRLGQQNMVSESGSFRLAGTVSSVEELLVVVREEKPAIVVVSDSINETSDAASLVQALRELSPKSAVVVTLSNPKAFWESIEARPDAFCDRDAHIEQLHQALNAVSRGQRHIAPSLCEYLLNGDGLQLLQNAVPKICPNAASELESLSRREREVMQLLSEGRSNENIAKQLGLSIQTVKVHVKHILKKLNVQDRTQAVIKALKNGVA